MRSLPLAAIMLPFEPAFTLALVCAAVGGLMAGWAMRELSRPVADEAARLSVEWAVRKASFALEDDLTAFAKRCRKVPAKVIPFPERAAA